MSQADHPILRRLARLRHLSGRDRLTRYERAQRRPFKIATIVFAISGVITLRFLDSAFPGTTVLPVVGGACIVGTLVTGVIAESRSPRRGLLALLAVVVASGLAFWAYLGWPIRGSRGLLYSTPFLVTCACAAAVLMLYAARSSRR